VSRAAPLLCSLLSLAGCYASHESARGRPPGEGGLAFDAGRLPDGAIVLPDGRVVAPDARVERRDGGPLIGVDAFVPPFDAGPNKPALRFGRSTFFDTPGDLVYDFAGDSTFELWVRSREVGSRDYCQKGEMTGARDFIVGQRDGHFVGGWQFGEANLAIAEEPLELDRWTHVAVVRRLSAAGDAHDIELYVDGELAGSAFALPDLDRTFNVHELRCGFADVDLDEVRVWRVARTQDEIIADMSRAIRRPGELLVSYWRMEEGGQILLDYTGRGRVAILGSLTIADDEDPIWIFDGPF
jgi:hypothetical protein